MTDHPSTEAEAAACTKLREILFRDFKMRPSTVAMNNVFVQATFLYFGVPPIPIGKSFYMTLAIDMRIVMDGDPSELHAVIYRELEQMWKDADEVFTFVRQWGWPIYEELSAHNRDKSLSGSGSRTFTLNYADRFLRANLSLKNLFQHG